MHQIPPKAAERLLDSVAFMNAEFGVAFNGMITINFGQLGRDGAGQAAEVITRLNEAVSRKLKRFASDWGLGESGEHRFLYVHEACETFGHHVHELVVMPYGLRLQFGAWLKEWARRQYGAADPKAVHYRASHWPRSLDQEADIQARLVRYVLKNMAPATARSRDGKSAMVHDLIGLTAERRSSSFKGHRVAGTSQNIGRAAQMRAGHEPPSYFEDLLSVSNLERYRSRQMSAVLQDSVLALGV